MATHTTLTSDAAWRPDVQGFAPESVVPEALILRCSSVVGNVEGDAPAVRVPMITGTSEPGFVPEGTEIPEGTGQLDEAVVMTRKLAELGRFSREQLAQPRAVEMITRELSKGIVRSGNKAFLQHTGDGPLGLIGTAGLTAVNVGTNLDTIVDALATVEANDGTPSHILASPDAWADVSKLKEGTGSAKALLGSGVEAGARQLLGVPVVVTAAMPANMMLAVDKTAVLSSVGLVEVARSDDAAFTSDSSIIRVTWRLGWVVSHPARLALFSTAG